MRTQPAMTVLVPADPAQTRAIVRAAMDLPGPAYLRVGKGGNPEVPGLGGRFAFGRPEVVRPGREILLLAAGPIVHEALAAAERLAGSVGPPRWRSSPISVSRRAPFSSTCWPRTATWSPSRTAIRREAWLAGGGDDRAPRPRLPSPRAWSGRTAHRHVGRRGLHARRPRPRRSRPRRGDPSPARGPGLSGLLLSVVLPCRNQADHIARVLESYEAPLAALAGGYELVVVPNACTDATPRIVEDLAARDSHVRAVPIPLGGWGRAVLAGLAAARGQWLCYTNSARTDPAHVPALLELAAGARRGRGQGAARAPGSAPSGDGLLALQPGGPPALRHPRPRRERHAEDPAPNALRSPRPPLAGRPPGPGAAGAGGPPRRPRRRAAGGRLQAPRRTLEHRLSERVADVRGSPGAPRPVGGPGR